jgi:hypothetical protein
VLEVLEERAVPTCTAFIEPTFAGDNLHIECDVPGNTITLDHSGSNTLVTINSSNWTFSDTSYDFDADIRSGGGGSTVNILRTGPYRGAHVSGIGGSVAVNLGVAGNLQGILSGVSVSNQASHNTTVNVYDYADSGFRTATIATAGSWENITGLTPGGSYIRLFNGDITTAYVYTGSAGATVNVQSLSVNTYLNGYYGHTNVIVGSGGSVQGLLADLTIYHSYNITDSVTVDDSNDTVGRTVYQSTNGNPGFGQIIGLAPHPIFYWYNNTAAVTIKTGHGGTTVNVLTTVTPLTLISDDTTTVNLGAGSVRGIWADVTITNPPSFTTINVDDRADSSSLDMALTAAGATGTVRLPPPDIFLPPVFIHFAVSDVAAINIDSGSNVNTFAVNVSSTTHFFGTTLNTRNGNDTVNVEATKGPLTVNEGSGAVTVNVSPSAHNLNTIQGTVTISGGSGTDTLVLNDASSTANQTYTLTAMSASRTGAADINFGSLMNYVTLNGGGHGTNTYTVTGTGAINETRLNLGGDNVTVNVENTTSYKPLTVVEGSSPVTVNISPSARNLDSIQGGVTISTGTGAETLVVYDQNNAANQSYTLAATSVTRTGAAAVNFAPQMNYVTLNGGSGNNTYSVTGTGAVLGTTLNTGNGADTVNMQVAGGAITLNGGGGNNTLVGPSAANTWRITGLNAGSLNSSMAFSGFRNLTGGPGADTFIFNNGQGVNGTINGGGGANALDYTGYTTPVTVNLPANTATGVGGTIANLQSFTGGSSGNNTLVGLNTGINIWQITSTNAGTLSSSITFSGFQNLTGGTSANSFVFSNGAGVTGTINGGGSSILDYAAYTTGVTVDLSANTATGTGGVLNIQRLRGGSGNDSLTGNATGATTFLASPGNDTVTAAGGTNTLVGANATSTWNITGSNTGTLTFGAGTTTFTGVQNLTSTAAADTFVVSDGARVDGNINGFGDAGTLDYTAYTTAVTVDLSTNTATGVGAFLGGALPRNFIGGSGGNTLKGPNLFPTTWNITAQNAGTLSIVPASFRFTAFQNLIGGGGPNTFVFSDGAGVDGSISGGTGTNNTLNFAPYRSSVYVDLGLAAYATGVGGGVSNIQNVVGGNGGPAGTFNILIGNGGNVLTGGTGRRNLLIAGLSASTLIAGDGEDILIGGATFLSAADLAAIMAYWTGPDDYATRVNNLLSGTGVPELSANTVQSNGGGNTLTGHRAGATASKLYFGNGLDTTDAQVPPEVFVTIT